MFDAAMQRGPGGNNNPHGLNQHVERDEVNVYNIHVDPIIKRPEGTSRSYTLNRLRRKSPELFNAVLAGDRRSEDFKHDNVMFETPATQGFVRGS